MHFLLGLGLFLVLLYFWLSAHWFARTVMFLLVGFGGFFVFAFFFNNPERFPHGAGGDVFAAELAGALIVGWIVASLPIWLSRGRP